MGWLINLCPVVMLEILLAFSKILPQNVENKLKSKEAYLGRGGHMVLRVSLGPGGCWFPLNGRVLGTRGSRGRGEIFTGLVMLVNPEIKHSLNYYTIYRKFRKSATITCTLSFCLCLNLNICCTFL